MRLQPSRRTPDTGRESTDFFRLCMKMTLPSAMHVEAGHFLPTRWRQPSETLACLAYMFVVLCGVDHGLTLRRSDIQQLPSGCCHHIRPFWTRVHHSTRTKHSRPAVIVREARNSATRSSARIAQLCAPGDTVGWCGHGQYFLLAADPCPLVPAPVFRVYDQGSV